MKVGDKVIRTPQSFADFDIKTGKSAQRPMRGKVMYIHPKNRYYVVEFESGIRESFMV